MQAKKLLCSFIILLFVVLTKTSLYGQDRILITAMGEDVGYRVGLLNHHLDSTEWKRKISTGKELLSTLKGKPIQLWVNFSHGHHSRVFGKIPERKISFFSNGFVLSSNAGKVGEEGRTLEDLQNEIIAGNIQFVPGSLIILGACAVAVPNEETGIIFAQELANITGARVIAGEHKTEPLTENNKKMVFTNVKNFIEFRPYQSPVILGNQLDLIATINTYLENYEFVDEIVVQNNEVIIEGEKRAIQDTEIPDPKEVFEVQLRLIQDTQVPEDDELLSQNRR